MLIGDSFFEQHVASCFANVTRGRVPLLRFRTSRLDQMSKPVELHVYAVQIYFTACIIQCYFLHSPWYIDMFRMKHETLNTLEANIARQGRTFTNYGTKHAKLRAHRLHLPACGCTSAETYTCDRISPLSRGSRSSVRGWGSRSRNPGVRVAVAVIATRIRTEVPVTGIRKFGSRSSRSPAPSPGSVVTNSSMQFIRTEVTEQRHLPWARVTASSTRERPKSSGREYKSSEQTTQWMTRVLHSSS